MKRRLLSAILVLCMTFTALPAAAHAAENSPEVVSGGAIGVIEDTQMPESEPAAQNVDENITNTQNNRQVDLSSSPLISGTCGYRAEAEWQLNTLTGIITFSGTGGISAFSVPLAYRQYIKTAIVKDGITSIDDLAFKDCTNLTKIELPNSVASIGEFAFYGTALTNVIIPDSVTSIGPQVFSHCTNLTNVSLPNSITSISTDAFYGCTALTNITIPSSVTSIGSFAFADCSSLTSITIPDSVAHIGEFAFQECSSLVNITIPNSVTSIGDSAFKGCSSLITIIIPNEMTYIDLDCFSGCTSLTNIFIPTNITKISGYSDDFNSLAHIYYAGSERDWLNIQIMDKDFLENIQINYNSSPNSIPQPFEYDFYPSGSNAKKISVGWHWNLFNRSSTSSCDYNLAKMGLILSSAAEHSADSTETLLKKLGFDTVQPRSENYEHTWNEFDLPAVTFGYKQLTINGEVQHIFAVVARGTSSFDDILTDLSSVFGGFDTAGECIYNLLENYIINQNWCGLSPENIRDNAKFFVTGHSLGGALANIVANRLNAYYGADNVFAYTYATPRTSKKPSVKENLNIYNFLNTAGGDPVISVPPNYSYRYGRDIALSSPVDSSSYNSVFIGLTGQEYGERLDLGNILKPHFVQSYMAHLLAYGNPADALQVLKGMIVTIACPVDVDVYSSDGKLVGSVKNNAVSNIESDKINIYIENDTKYIHFEDDEEYTIKLMGTDSGTMEYTAQSIDLSNCEIISEKAFRNVELFNGKQMVSYVNVKNETESGTDVPQIPLYVLDSNGNLEKEVLPDGSGTEIPLIHTITLDANGGTVSPSALKTDHTGKLNNLPVPSRTGYRFSGWHTEINGGTQVSADTVFDKDSTIYARWTYVPGSSSSGSSTGNSSSNGGYYGGSGYYTGGSNNYTTCYNVTFDANGGTVDTITLKTGTNGKLSNLPVPIRNDYKFDGWYTKADEGTMITTETVFNKNTTVYAHWTYVEPSDQPAVPDTGNEQSVSNPFPEESTAIAHKKGGQVMDADSRAIYKITKMAYTNGTGGTVSYVSSTDKEAADITIPKTITLDGVIYKVTKICKNAFKNNMFLKSVTIGKNVKTVGNSAFYGCKNLERAVIGSGVKTIWSKAFYKCRNLTKIVIPAKVTTIGKQAFFGCIKLKSITLKTVKLTSKNVGTNAFKGIASNVMIKVPSKSLKKYGKLLPAKGVGEKARIE